MIPQNLGAIKMYMRLGGFLTFLTGHWNLNDSILILVHTGSKKQNFARTGEVW